MPAYTRGRVTFDLLDEIAPWNAGTWTLTIEDGAGSLVRTAADTDLWLHGRGFAALACSATTGAAAVPAGLAGGVGDPAALDLLASGPPAQLLDHS